MTNKEDDGLPSMSGSLTLSIAAVERDTGLSKDTLRVWERRYGFPLPRRDDQGERAYSQQDVEKLRVLRRLLDAGHRPGRIVRQPIEALQALASQAAAAARPAGADEPPDEELHRFIDLVRAHDVEALRGALSQAALRLGIGRFVMERAAPLNELIGASWARGEIEVYEEHLYTESMQVVLRNAIATIPPAKAAAMIDDALAQAEFYAPCITNPEFAHRRAVKSILRGAILRWHEAGTGAVVSQTSGMYGQTIDNRQPRKTMFYPSEIDQLKKLCRSDVDVDDGGAFAIDLFPPPGPRLSARQEFERDVDTTW